MGDLIEVLSLELLKLDSAVDAPRAARELVIEPVRAGNPARTDNVMSERVRVSTGLTRRALGVTAQRRAPPSRPRRPAQRRCSAAAPEPPRPPGQTLGVK